MNTPRQGRDWAVGARGDAAWLRSKPETYETAGVSRSAGSEAVRRIAELARSTFSPAVITDIGGFGGLYAWEAAGESGPLLVASTDGVGTKAVVARATARYDTIGRDLVAMNTDDIVVYGARPLFLLDFVLVGSVDPEQIESLVSGVAAGCRDAGCALLGGEVAEHPGTIPPGEFDLVGFVVGSVERDKVITGERIRPGDVVIGLTAAGMRSDGYSFVRKIFANRDLEEPAYPGAEHSLGEELMRPSVIYTPGILKLIEHVDVHGLAHVTGGGIATNVGRITPADCEIALHRGAWPIPPIFGEMTRWAQVAPEALEDSLPIGIGMVAIVAPQEAKAAIDTLSAAGFEALEIGEVRTGDGRAYFTDRKSTQVPA